MAWLGTLPPIGPNQKQTVGLDFGDFLPSGVTLTGTATATLTVVYGADPEADEKITDGPDVGTISTANGGSGVTNAAILLQVSEPVLGAVYVLDVYCGRTDGDVAEGSTKFACALVT